MHGHVKYFKRFFSFETKVAVFLESKRGRIWEGKADK